MGGWLWFHGWRWALGLIGMPLFNPIQILGGYSLLWALVALWFFYQIIDELLHERLSGAAHSRQLGLTDGANQHRDEQQIRLYRLFPWLLSAFYAVTYFFWVYATTTEQYTSAIAQTLAIVYFYLQFQKAASAAPPLADHGHITPTLSRQRLRIINYVLLLALLCGLSLAHMLTVAFIVPPLVLVILWQVPWLWSSGRALFGSVVAAAVPLISYFYVYIRGRTHPEWWGEGDWRTPNEWFWSFVSTAQGRDELARGFEAWCGPLAGGFPGGMWRELSLPILVLGIVGIAFLGKRRAVMLYGTLVIYLIFCWMYRCGNWFQVILPVYPLILLGLIPLVSRYWQRVRDKQLWLTLVPYLLLLIAIVWRIDGSWPRVDGRNRVEDTALASVAHLINDSIPLGSALFATLDDALALQYLNGIWGIRPDLEIADHKVARQRVDIGQFVLTRYDSVPQLLSEMREGTTVGLWSVSADWVALQDVTVIDEDSYGDPEIYLNLRVEEGVELVGYTFVPSSVTSVPTLSVQQGLEIILYWRLDNPPWPDGLSISLRPTKNGAFIPQAAVDPAADPNAIIQQDQKRPMQGLEPISRIPAGQHFGDAYRLPLPPPTEDGESSADGLLLILYRATADGFTNVAEVPLPIQ